MIAQNSTIIDILLQHDANPNLAENVDVGGNTPLHEATLRNMIDVVQTFVRNGAELEIKNQ